MSFVSNNNKKDTTMTFMLAHGFWEKIKEFVVCAYTNMAQQRWNSLGHLLLNCRLNILQTCTYVIDGLPAKMGE